MRAAVADLDIPVVLTRTLMQSLEDREALARTVLAAADRVRQVTDAADIWAVVPVKDTAARKAAARAGAARRSAAGAGAGDARRRAGGARRSARPRRPSCWSRSTRRRAISPPATARSVSTTAPATAIPARSRRRRGVSPPRGAAHADPARRHPARHRRRDRAPDRRASPGARPSRSRRRMTRWARTRSSCRRPMRCRCASATTVSSRISPPPAARGIEPTVVQPARHRIGYRQPGRSRAFLRNSDRARERACGSRDMLALSHRPVSRRPTPGTQPPS